MGVRAQALENAVSPVAFASLGGGGGGAVVVNRQRHGSEERFPCRPCCVRGAAEKLHLPGQREMQHHQGNPQATGSLSAEGF